MLTTTWCELFLDWFACAMYLWHLLDVTPLRWCYVLMLRVVLIAYKTIDTNWSYVYQLCYPKLIPITSIAVADTQIYHSCKSSILPIVAEKFLLCMGFTSEPKFAARDHEELWEAQEGRPLTNAKNSRTCLWKSLTAATFVRRPKRCPSFSTKTHGFNRDASNKHGEYSWFMIAKLVNINNSKKLFFGLWGIVSN